MPQFLESIPLEECALPNGNEKRHPETAIETATRSGKMRRSRKPSFSDPFTTASHVPRGHPETREKALFGAETGHSPVKDSVQRKGKGHAGKARIYKLIQHAGFQTLLNFAIPPFPRCGLGLSVKNPPTSEIGFRAKKELLRGY